MFIHNGEAFDYNYRETIACMKAFADKVVVIDAGSTDGTGDICEGLCDSKTTVIRVSNEEWNQHKGRGKISYFQNEAKRLLDTEYHFQMQADEILHESCFGAVREAISWGMNAYMVNRINLWFDPWHQLNVPQDRKPCSTSVVRLAKTRFDSVDDGESLCVPSVAGEWLDQIRLYHMGFVRDRTKMKSKVIHIQEQVFGTPHDHRLDDSDQFDPARFFDFNKDVILIGEKLPVFIQQWVAERYPNGPLFAMDGNPTPVTIHR